MNRWEFLYTFLLILAYIKRFKCARSKKFTAVVGSEMKNSISTVPLGSSSECGILCNDRNDCASFSYTESTKTCRLNDKDPSSAPSDVVARPDSNLYVRVCPSGWTYNRGSCYLFVSVQRGWEDAKDNCASQDAHLLQVEDTEEHDFIRSVISVQNYEHYYWIGLRYDNETDQYLWTDGAPETFLGWGPNRPGGSKGCVNYLNYEEVVWQWNANYDCVSTLGPFICEID